MKKIWIVFLLLLSFQFSTFASGIPEEDLPWPQEITEKAKEAIFLSIENLSKPIDECDPSFPEGRLSPDFYFPYVDSEDFKVVGYSYPEGSSVYTINFHGIEFMGSGPRIAVEIDIKTSKVFEPVIFSV